jgi:hypothetical protein
MAMIEGLENRIVFAATGVGTSGVEAAAARLANDPAVAATLVQVQVDRAAVDVARDAVKRAATAGAAKIRAVSATGGRRSPPTAGRSGPAGATPPPWPPPARS